MSWRISIDSSLSFGRIYQWTYLGLGFPLWEVLKLQIWFLYLLQVYSDFLFLLRSDLAICVFLRTSYFIYFIWFVGIKLFVVFLYNSFYFCKAGSDVLIFISNFSVKYSFSAFFLVTLAKGLSIFLVFLKDQIFVFIFLNHFSILYFIFSALIFIFCSNLSSLLHF